MDEEEFNEIEELVNNNVKLHEDIGNLVMKKNQNEYKLKKIFNKIISPDEEYPNYIEKIDFRMGVIIVEKSNNEFDKILDRLGFEYNIVRCDYKIKYILYEVDEDE